MKRNLSIILTSAFCLSALAAPPPDIQALLNAIGYKVEALQEKADRPPVTNIVTVYITNVPPVIVTNIVVPPGTNNPPLTTNTLSEEGIRVEFDLSSSVSGPSGLPQGVLFVAPGVEVMGDFQAQAIYIKFHPAHHGVRLYKKERGVSIAMPAPPQDGHWHHYVASCDLRRIAAAVDGRYVQVQNFTNSFTNVLYIGNSHNGWMSDHAYREGSRTDGSDKWNRNVQYRNISVTRFPVSHPGARYKFRDFIGNSSVPVTGQGVHSGFHPYKQFVAWGNWIFMHNGYDEGRHQLKRFRIDNPQFITDRFGNRGKTLGTDPSGQPVDLAVANNQIHVKTADGLVDSYNPETLAPVKLRHTTFPQNTSSTWQGLTASVDYENHQFLISGSAGVLQVIGQPGGYKNGPMVSLDKFGHYYFDGPVPTQCAFACFQSDGKLWLSDAATSRVLRYERSPAGQFEPDGEVIQFVPHTSYVCSVDVNNPIRVFSRYLEFFYDYDLNFWTLVRNWEPPQGSGMHGFMDGLHSVRTVGGKTIALANRNGGPQRQLVELTPTGLQTTGRFTDPSKGGADWRLDPDGKVTYWKNEGATATFWTYDFQTPEIQIGTISLRSPIWFVRRAGDRIITYAPQAAVTGPHLGSVRNNAWEWFAAPTGPFNGLGNFDPWCGHYDGPSFKVAYAGDMVPHAITGNSIFIHHYGEFYRQSGQANQTLEFDTNGNFIGQCGVLAFDYTDLAAPMSASNSKSIEAVQVKGKTYIFLGNEQSVGVQVAVKE